MEQEDIAKRLVWLTVYASMRHRYYGPSGDSKGQSAKAAKQAVDEYSEAFAAPDRRG